MKTNRNEPCPCGSGLKYKKCCLSHATESSTISYGWRKLRVTDGELTDQLMHYAADLFGKAGLEAAWEEFHGFSKNTPEIADELMVFEQAFLPWFLYNWCPDPNDDITADLPTTVAAEHYLARKASKVDGYKKSFIHASLDTHYSIYEVIHIVRHQSITLKDVLRGHIVTIHEKLASESLQKSHIIMARIVTINEDSIACGMYPAPLPARCLLSFVEFKQHYCKNNFFTNDMLFDRDLEIRTFFMNIVADSLDNPFPTLQNTDGEELSMNKIHYSLTCTPQRAFDALVELAAGINKLELSKDGVYDAKHQLIEISFPWCTIGNRVHKDWQNTVYGHITIKNGSLTIDVNSVERAQSVLFEIDSRLNKKEAEYLHTERKSIESVLSEPHENKPSPSEDSPEMKSMLQELTHKHWVAWLDTDIPALHHVTPRKAAKTKLGRERLEALFVDFHQKNQSGFLQCPVDLNFLRKELNMT